MRFRSLSTVKSVSETHVGGRPSLFRASISDPLQPQKSDIISFTSIQTNLIDTPTKKHFPYYTIYFAPLQKAVNKS